MLGAGPATGIYWAVGVTDLRRGFEGLFGLTPDRLRCEPLGGRVLLLRTQQRNRLPKKSRGSGAGRKEKPLSEESIGYEHCQVCKSLIPGSARFISDRQSSRPPIVLERSDGACPECRAHVAPKLALHPPGCGSNGTLNRHQLPADLELHEQAIE